MDCNEELNCFEKIERVIDDVNEQLADIKALDNAVADVVTKFGNTQKEVLKAQNIFQTYNESLKKVSEREIDWVKCEKEKYEQALADLKNLPERNSGDVVKAIQLYLSKFDVLSDKISKTEKRLDVHAEDVAERYKKIVLELNTGVVMDRVQKIETEIEMLNKQIAKINDCLNEIQNNQNILYNGLTSTLEDKLTMIGDNINRALVEQDQKIDEILQESQKSVWQKLL